MKKLLLMLLTAVPGFLLAQNVSVNTTGAPPEDPKAMLEVRRPAYSKLKIRTDSYSADTSVIELSNRTSSNVGTAMLFSLINEEGLLISTASDLPDNTRDSLFSLKVNGNMGFGIRNPAYNYHFHTPASAINLVSITTNTTGITGTDGLLIGMSAGNGVINNMEGNSLRLGTGNFTRLAIDGVGNVGVGTLTPAYKLDVNGDVNLNGVMRINGSAGTAGQVLTSNGTSDPQWKSTSFSNNVRFAVDIGLVSPATSSSATGGILNITGTKYNLDPTSVAIGASTITISRSGLYHFECFYDVQFFYASVTTANSPFLSSYITVDYPGGFSHHMAYIQDLRRKLSTNGWYFNGKASFDVYIQAPRVISFYSGLTNLDGPTNSVIQQGMFYGHLISD